ncbi:MAG: hypothetical protein QM715_20200 [Nibricoccus sp.]
MNKQFCALLICLSLVMTTAVYAQNTFPSSGNVGIGTTNPGDKLVISDGDTNAISIRAGETAGIGFNRAVTGGGIYNTAISAWQFSARDSMFSLEGYNGAFPTPWTVLKNGNVGIGTTSPSERFTVTQGGMLLDNHPSLAINGELSAAIRITAPGGWARGYGIVNSQNQTKVVWGALGAGDDLNYTYIGPSYSNPWMILNPTGNVGIGTTSPTEKLSVKGRIRAQEVIVETTNWSDHVFADSYKLQSLSEVEQHIKTEKHLPGVPSAQEVAEKGVSVGNMQAILLAKIEELTLHVIAQEKEQIAQRAKLEAQSAELASLKAENSKLRAQTN